MAASAPRTFSSVGQISRARVSVALGLAVAGVVVAVVVARAGKATERDAALEAARHLLAVAEEWHATNGETGCPTPSGLVDERVLDPDARVEDAWGNRFRILCEDTGVIVRSPGPDGRHGTPDDVSYRR